MRSDRRAAFDALFAPIPLEPHRQESPTPAVQVEVVSIHLVKNDGRLRAIADIKAGPWLIRGYKIFHNGNRKWVMPPALEGTDGNWRTVISCGDPVLDNIVKEAILAAYDHVLNGGKLNE